MARFDPNKPQKIRTTTGRGTTEQLKSAPRRYDQMTAAQKKAYRLKTLGAKGEAARAKRIASVKPASTVTAPGAPAPKPAAKPAATKPVVNRNAPEGGWYPRPPSKPATADKPIELGATPKASASITLGPTPSATLVIPRSATRVPTDSGTLSNRRRLTNAERAALRADYERKGIFP